MVKVKIDMTGWVMAEHGVADSKLTVITRAEDYITPSGKAIPQWLCECSCPEHNRIIVSGTSIKNGHTKSCGCLRIEKFIDRTKQYNKYDLSGEYGIGWTSNTNEEFYFDLEDYDKIKDYCWFKTKSKNYIMLMAKDPSTRKHIYMHWLVMGKKIDHINRNTLDNRKTNLRFVTEQENVHNHSLFSNNTSGFTGVYWREKRGKWEVGIMIDNQPIYLGFFNNQFDAIRARLQAELKYFGAEFAPQRHLFEEYGINTTQQNDLKE